MGWKDDARRTIVSGKKDLASFPGYWIKVKKYSIRGKDEINGALASLQASLDKKALYSLAQKTQERSRSSEELTKKQVFELLSEDEISAYAASSMIPMGELNRLRLKHGVAAHNFVTGDPDIGTDNAKDIEVFANDILEYADIVEEIISQIEDYNRPLATTTSGTSGTSPSGSTEEAVSTSAMNYQTDATLPS